MLHLCTATGQYGGFLPGRGAVNEAIRLYEQTLADRERLLGTEHPNTVKTRKLLTLAREDAGRDGED